MEKEHAPAADEGRESAGGEGPGSGIRSLAAEAEARGAPMASAESMQSRLFTLYDAASAVPEALELVQRQLQLTLGRTWYSREEIDRLADEIDRLLGPATWDAGSEGRPSVETDDSCPAS
jgi:hypothetical protein